MNTRSKITLPPMSVLAPYHGMRLRALLTASVLLPLSAGLVLAQDKAPAVAQPADHAAAPVKDAAGAQVAAPAAAPAPITPASTPNDAVKVLLQQANYWKSQYKPAQAVDALNRVLQIDSRNADALASLAQLQAERGNMSAAQNAAARLEADWPGDPRIPAIKQALRVGPINKTALSEARHLAEEGRSNEAVEQYQRVFKGSQPASGLATEYYSVMSGTDSGWEQAREGLAKQVKANPQDMRAQLAYAQLLTYREPTRAEGITRLNQLTANSATAADASKALRQALLWLPSNKSSVNQLQTFLQRHPDDTEIAQHLEAARNPPQSGPTDVEGGIRAQGYADLNRGRLDKAASRFELAMRHNASDADAVAGLGIVRLRQGRTAEARRLLEHAIALNPSKRRQWQAALAGAESGGGQAVGRQWNEVRRLADRGNYAEAEAKLRPLLGPHQGNTGGLLLLADIQQRAGQFAESESTYRTVLGRQPGNSAAVIGLAGVLSHEGRTAEADQLFAQAERAGAKGVGQLRAQQLRQQAEAVNDPAAQAGLYRAAIAIDPSNPWLKLELARVLVKQNRVSEARAVMGGVGEQPHASADSIRAGLIFANEINDLPTAQALIARLPKQARTPDMQRAIAEAQVKSDIANAAQLYYVNRPLARERMLALAATPDDTGVHGAEVARAFLKMGDRLGAQEAISTAMSANRNPTPAARLEYSAVLLQAGQTNAAAMVASSVNAARNVTPNQRAALNDLQSGIAVRAADQLAQQGRVADAYDRLAPALAQDPTDPALNMALSRLYAAHNQPGQALAINEALLRQDPTDLSVRRAAVGAAIQARQYGRAERLVQDGLQMAPNDPRVWIMSADLAKAQGNNSRALHDYQVARDLRRQQLSGDVVVGQASGGGATMGQAPNILSAPTPYAPNAPYSPADAPTPLDSPRRNGRSSERDDPHRQRDAESDPQGFDEHLDPIAQVHLAESVLPGFELAQETLPYYVSPAPALTPQTTGGDMGAAGGGVGPYAGYPQVQPSIPSALPAYPSAPPAYGALPYAAPAYTAPAYTAPAMTGGAMDASGYANPFRTAAPPPGMGMDQQNTAAPGILGGTPYAAPAAPADPLTRDIDQNIASLREEVAPKVQAGVGIRFRTGTPGLDRLTEEFTPLEATYSPGIGQLKLQVTPTFLQAGNVSRGTSANGSLTGGNLNRFGTLPLYANSVNTPSPGNQSASGVGLDVTYGWKWVSVDLGSTPFGFREQSAIGGVELAPQIANNLVLRITGERRAVTDSVLSYAGTQDPRTGLDMGGVTRNRGHIQLEYSVPNGLNLYAGGGYGYLQGTNVQDNTEGEAGVGGSYPVYTGTDDQLRVGLDLVYFGYQRNLDFFTLGGGGYFSPQSYFAALVPVTYRQTVDNFTWSIGASLGFQSYHANSSPIFPGNPGGLQTQLETLAANINSFNPNTPIQTRYAGQTDFDFAGGLQAEAEYKITPSFAVGGRAGVQHTGNFTEGGGLVYARYTFGGTTQ